MFPYPYFLPRWTQDISLGCGHCSFAVFSCSSKADPSLIRGPRSARLSPWLLSLLLGFGTSSPDVVCSACGRFARRRRFKGAKNESFLSALCPSTVPQGILGADGCARAQTSSIPGALVPHLTPRKYSTHVWLDGSGLPVPWAGVSTSVTDTRPSLELLHRLANCSPGCPLALLQLRGQPDRALQSITPCLTPLESPTHPGQN